jgi:hypothetical protein
MRFYLIRQLKLLLVLAFLSSLLNNILAISHPNHPHCTVHSLDPRQPPLRVAFNHRLCLLQPFPIQNSRSHDFSIPKAANAPQRASAVATEVVIQIPTTVSFLVELLGRAAVAEFFCFYNDVGAECATGYLSAVPAVAKALFMFS